MIRKKLMMSTIGMVNLSGYRSAMNVVMPKRFEDGLGYLVHHLMYAFRQTLAEQCLVSGYPITADELGIVMMLHQAGHELGLTQKQLADTLAKDKAVITRLLNSLAGKKLILRTADTKDRRVVRVSLTEAGLAAAETLRPKLMEVLKQAYSDISDEEFQLARDVLARMLSNVREISPK